MRIPIDELKAGAGSRIAFDNAEPVTIEGLAVEGAVRLQGTVSNASSRLLVKGEMHCTINIPCSRCAEVFATPLRVEIDEEFLPRDSAEAKENEAFPWSGVNTYAFEDQAIILTEVIRQNALAATPIQALCSAGCRGLCPQCGCNHNQQACQCADQAGDPRLQALRDLQMRLQGAQPSNN